MLSLEPLEKVPGGGGGGGWVGGGVKSFSCQTQVFSKVVVEFGLWQAWLFQWCFSCNI